MQEAARLMAESGIESFDHAKRKARERLNLPATAQLPKNHEIEAALLEYRALFGGDVHDQQLRAMRKVAADAMQALQEFKPRLVGPVLSGTADENSSVCLHLFAESAEDVAFYLMDQQIPFRYTERRLRMSTGSQERIPAYAFVVDGTEIELVAFSGKLRRQAPISAVDGHPMRRASLSEVRALIDTPQPALP